MANDILEPETASANTSGRTAAPEAFASFSTGGLEEKPIWSTLYEQIHDVFFPVKLPPLELTSQPIPVPDRMAVKTNPWAVGISGVVNGSIVAFLLFLGIKHVVQVVKANSITPIDVSEWNAKAAKAASLAGGGGSGGDRSIEEPIKGRTPPKMKDPIINQVQTVDKPKLPEQAAIDVQQNIQLPDNPNMPTLGAKNSQNVKLAVGGPGSGGGIGYNSGGGDGTGRGNGYGSGIGSNCCSGLERIGGGVSAPSLVHSVEAEFSDEARRAKYQGVCVVQIIVDKDGNPRNPRVVRTLGMGLDERAIEAIKQYKFRPAMKNGQPVAVQINVEVNFHLY